MNLTPEQIEFIRRHGLTRCPAGPTFDVCWESHRGAGKVFEPSERELFNELRRGSGVRAVLGPPGQPVMNLSDGDLGRPQDRRWKAGRRRRRSATRKDLTNAAVT